MEKPVPGQVHHKYVRIYQELRQQLSDGMFREGERLPTEKNLSDRYEVSRPTVTKALDALEAEGLISRKIGSGSYARAVQQTVKNNLFGLLIPGLGRGEIFEPICAQIAALAEKHNFSLLWSGFEKNTRKHPPSSEAIARRYIEHKVAGVFFEPLELLPGYDNVNRNVIGLLEQAGIPVVLIDADYQRFPERSRYDLVGLDNFHAGYTAARHLLDHKVNRVDFLRRPYSADTVTMRLRGYNSALLDAGITADPAWVLSGDPEDPSFIHQVIHTMGARNIICGNDETAAALMVALEHNPVAVQDHFRIIGFDDVRYARHLKVPLTTVRQPCEEIGTLAVETMLWRVAHPGRPPRTICVPGSLVIRQSCGCGS